MNKDVYTGPEDIPKPQYYTTQTLVMNTALIYYDGVRDGFIMGKNWLCNQDGITRIKEST